MRSLFRSLTACLLAAALVVLVAGAASAQPEQLIVRPGESIQAAINAASPGATITVLGGVHHETVVISKDGLTVRGVNTSLEPPLTPTSPCGQTGFCVSGAANSTITGFTVRNFGEFGIEATDAQNAKFISNSTFNNGEYGIAAFSSTGTQIISNVTSGSEEAGIYVGDSPQANAAVVNNDTYGNSLGVFVRNALHGQITSNAVHNNCMGILVLADAPGPAGAFNLAGNLVQMNTRACPASEEAPAISGVGIGLLGANSVAIQGNQIFNNIPSGPTAYSGGVVVVSGFGGTPPTGNTVSGNIILNNGPDIFWDQTGLGNRFAGNACRTSTPVGLCRVLPLQSRLMGGGAG